MGRKPIREETLVAFDEGKKLVPEPNAPSTFQMRTWADNGLRSKRSGKQVFLEWFQIGQRRFTSLEAYERFEADLNAEGV